MFKHSYGFTNHTTKIFEIRDQKVMLDFDLAKLYDVEIRILNQAVKEILIVSQLILCLDFLKRNGMT